MRILVVSWQVSFRRSTSSLMMDSAMYIRVSTKKNFKNAKKITTKKNVVTVKKLKAGKKYFVKVRAFKKVGNKKIYGNYSAVKKVIVKK